MRENLSPWRKAFCLVVFFHDRAKWTASKLCIPPQKNERRQQAWGAATAAADAAAQQSTTAARTKAATTAAARPQTATRFPLSPTEEIKTRIRNSLA